MRHLPTVFRRLALAIMLSMAGAVAAQKPAFDPRDWRGQHAGQPTEVLTIGSPHLSQLSTPPTLTMMAPLIDRLAAYKPEIITVEGISGEQCDILQRYVTRYPGMFETYCRGTEEASKATGLDVAAALAAIEKMLANWPALPSFAQRRLLAALFLAAGDRPSAQVQWRRLPVAERHLGDGIDDALLNILSRADAKSNETFDVAVPLAVRLGLERVYLVDDHTADNVQALAGPGFQPALEKIWASASFPAAEENKKMAASLKDGADMLRYYRFLNGPRIQRGFVTGDYHRAMNTPSPEQYGRQYLAWWETRNLRMVANIRAAFGNRPGARVLNIVGASHKPYYDAYLDMMSDVTLIDAEAVLGATAPR